MKALRHAVVDLLAAAFVLFAVLTGQMWALWVVYGYTGLMLALKVLALASGFAAPRPADAPPVALFHTLYGFCAIALLAGGQPVMGAGWLLLWGLAWMGERKALRPVTTPAGQPR